MCTVGVIGIGNPLRRDDGIGLIILNKLQQYSWPKHITFIDGGIGGMNLLHLLNEFNHVVFLDAVNCDQNPGSLQVFSPEMVQSKKPQFQCSTHGTDLLQIITLAKQLEHAPDKITIIGVQPKDISFGEGLSKKLQDCVDSLVDQAAEVIKTVINDTIHTT